MKKIVLLIALVIVIVLAQLQLDVNEVMHWLESFSNEPSAPLVFVLIYVVLSIVMVPGSVLMLLSATLFGFGGGFLYATIGANMACQITYRLSKMMGQDIILKWIKPGSFIDTAHTKASENGFLFITICRMIPVFPFAVVNYVPALIGIKHKDYTLGSFVGMLPGTFLYVLLGYGIQHMQEDPSVIWGSLVLVVLFLVIIIQVKKHYFK